MQLIRHSLDSPQNAAERVPIPVDRLTLAKRRWRGVADDGREFGFDLEQPLHDGEVVWRSADLCYVIAQKAEPLVVIRLGDSPGEAARRGWLFGNLHFPIALEGEQVLVPDDPAVRQLLAREGIAFEIEARTFRPCGIAHAHDSGPHHPPHH